MDCDGFGDVVLLNLFMWVRVGDCCDIDLVFGSYVMGDGCNEYMYFFRCF